MVRHTVSRSLCCMALAVVLASDGTASAGSEVRACSSAPETGFARRSLGYDGGSQSCVAGPGDCRPAIGARLPGEPATVYAVQRVEPLPSAPLPRHQCARTALVQPLSWISSAVWMPALNEILVAEGALGGHLLRISPSGAISPLGGRTLASGLRGVAELRDSFLLIYNDASLLKVDAFCNTVLARAHLGEGADGEPNGLVDLEQWTVVGDELVGYGAVRTPGDDYEIGLASARLLGANRLTVTDVKLLKTLNPSLTRKRRQQYYLLGHHYVTSNSLGAFFLAMDDEATLYWYVPSSGKVQPVPNAIPPPYRRIEALHTPFNGPRDGKAHYAEVEQRRIPVGIYGAGTFVYLLTREPDAGGTTTLWKVHKIDPVHGRLLGSVHLPTSAHHLSVVPTENSWYLFEKGNIDDAGSQRVGSLVIVPARWIEDVRSSPLREAVKPEVACVDLSREGPDQPGAHGASPHPRGPLPPSARVVPAAP